MKTILCLSIAICSLFASAQRSVFGTVAGNDGIDNTLLSGASVYWLNSSIGTVTDAKGYFKIPFTDAHNQLVISYIGYKTDTLNIVAPKELTHQLTAANNLEEVIVRKKQTGVEKSYYSAAQSITINSEELLKAACCNLSESFETNPTIDVNYSDALTGTKQIQMLGLTSPYLLITEENIPTIRGASQAYGLTYTPGTWVESIQITKGAGSVLHGYESISGQINTELVKPLTDEAFFINGYANRNGRVELNTHFNRKLSKRWSTGVYLHGNSRLQKEDINKDGFLDAPIGDQLNIMNRWQYQNVETGWVSFINLKFLNDNKQLGAVAFNPKKDAFTTNAWGSEIATRRLDASLKVGYVFPEIPYQSISFQAAFSTHDQNGYYGFNQYNIAHTSFYSNVFLSSIIGDTRSKFKTGFTAAYDVYDEQVNTQFFNRVDASIGAFFEYSFVNLEKVSITTGLRIDAHNQLGIFMTPRLHGRFTPWGRGSFRASIGSGRRAANIFAENQQVFGSSRQIQVLDTTGTIYGLDPEKAWNYGVSFLQGFTALARRGSISLDYYRTDFVNQVVVDWENPRALAFYNLEGKSFAKSFQVEAEYEVLSNVNVKVAYKHYDVKTQYNSGLLQKPLQASNRYFTNIGYSTKPTSKGAQWKFDGTAHILGKQRLPSTRENLPENQLPDFVAGYSLLNSQITRVFSTSFEVYLGGENLTNTTQPSPVLSADNPFGANFDTSILYAPVMGRMFYAGFRYKL